MKLKDGTANEAGEMVGFLGSNGAGKTTTLKVLSGLLYPTAGSVSVMGYTPYERQRAYLEQFTLVMGNKNQLLWDLPAMESFLVNRAIYEISPSDFDATLKELNQLLNLEPLLRKQVRKLSLGERMKCELAAALLHRPQVLFLDEPYSGLDIPTTRALRLLLDDIDATVVHVTHDPASLKGYDQVIWLEAGQIVASGTPAEVIPAFRQKMEDVGRHDDFTDLAS